MLISVMRRDCDLFVSLNCTYSNGLGSDDQTSPIGRIPSCVSSRPLMADSFSWMGWLSTVFGVPCQSTVVCPFCLAKTPLPCTRIFDVLFAVLTSSSPMFWDALAGAYVRTA